jgi:hypothetical protein
MDMKNVQQCNTVHPVLCLELHLREITLNNYRGTRPDINFVIFFILNAKVIHLMRLGIKYDHNKKWWSTQRKQLQLNNKGSAQNVIKFGTLPFSFDKFCVGGVKMVIHDLSVADPFAASF